jgi:hypothetical protein
MSDLANMFRNAWDLIDDQRVANLTRSDLPGIRDTVTEDLASDGGMNPTQAAIWGRLVSWSVEARLEGLAIEDCDIRLLSNSDPDMPALLVFATASQMRDWLPLPVA